MAKTYLARMGWVAVALGVACLCYSALSLSVEHDHYRLALQRICAKDGLEAIDLDYPHTPKCLNLTTGIMTVPKEFYAARGGRL